MPSIAPSRSTTITRVARVPYLNSAPYFRGLALEGRIELVDCAPREGGALAADGSLAAGLLPLADCLRLADAFERLGRFGVAVRGRARSAILFSRKPIRQLDGAVIAVTEETSTTFLLLRLLLEQRFRLAPASYRRGRHPEAEALLLIGDEALRFQRANTQYPFECDLAFEWWLWQHLPCVFAVWAIRRDADPDGKRRLERALGQALARNAAELEAVAAERSEPLGIPSAELLAYLSAFVYRLGPAEEDGIARFQALVEEHRLL
jgi:chorismate dehydratase